MYIIKVFFISYTICLLGACRQSSTSLEDALVRSGDNRKELEKVLSFYSTEESDSLKLRAAIFLITNMPGHHFYDGELVRKFHDSARINRNISFFTKKKLHSNCEINFLGYKRLVLILFCTTCCLIGLIKKPWIIGEILYLYQGDI